MRYLKGVRTSTCINMKFEDIYEPIEVITHFQEGRLRPLRFKWNGRVYKIRQWNGFWINRQGSNRQYHFSVQADNSDFVELMFDDADLQWQIARVCLDG